MIPFIIVKLLHFKGTLRKSRVHIPLIFSHSITIKVGQTLVGVRQTPEDTLVAALSPCSFNVVERMCDYFNLSHDLPPLYAQWAKAHARMTVRSNETKRKY